MEEFVLRTLARWLSPLKVQLVGFSLILVLSTIGFFWSGAGYSLSDSAFKALQLFGLNYDVGPSFEPHALVQIGRFLAPLFIAFAIIELVSRRLIGWLRNLGQSQMKGRVLLLGFGQVNRALLRHLQDSSGHSGPITVVDRGFDEADMRQARANGILMLEADMTDPDAIARLNPHAAKTVYVACGSDILNLEVGTAVAKCIDAKIRPAPGRIARERPYRYGCGKDLEEIVNVHIASPKLMNDLARSQDMSFPLGSGLRFFSFKAATATALLAKARFALRAKDIGQYTSHLVLCCAGEVAEAILIQTLSLAVSIHGIPRITIVDKDTDAAQQRFHAHYPRLFDEKLPTSARPKIAFLKADISALCFETDKRLSALEQKTPPPSAWIFAGRSDELNIAAALRLESAMSIGARRQVPVYARAWEGQLATSSHDLGLTKLFGRIHDNDVCRLIVDREVETLAREIHAEYLGEKATTLLGSTNGAPFVAEWGSLPEDVRQANVRAALHLPQRIEDLGLDWRGRSWGKVPCVSEDDAPFRALDARVKPKILKDSAETEHVRWIIDRAINGWRKGPRSNRAKRHPMMINYARLSSTEKSLDLTSLRAARRLSMQGAMKASPKAWPRKVAEYAVEELASIDADATAVVLHFGRSSPLLSVEIQSSVANTFTELRWHSKLCRVRVVVHGDGDIALAFPAVDGIPVEPAELKEDRSMPFQRWIGGLAQSLPDGVAVDIDFIRK